jgi:acetylornithine deacetylase/succinyl-diaminopimelate desuccinylase-like protein
MPISTAVVFTRVIGLFAMRMKLRWAPPALLTWSIAWMLVCAPAAADSAAPQPPPETRTLARKFLKELIAINSTHTYGSSGAAHWVTDQLRAAGFADQDIHELAPGDHPTKGNAVVRLHGRNKAKPILFIGHLDVVEAKREDWNFDPFSLTERDGWLYGRGTIDMKGQDVALLATLIRMKHEGYVPDRDIVVAFTADEEAGGDANGVKWLLKEHPDLIAAGLVINPDGGEAAVKSGRKLYVALQTSEKVFLTFGLEATDKGGHSSRPTAANPIDRLAKGLERLSGFAFPVHLTDTTKLYFTGRAGLESGQKKMDMQAMGRAPLDAGAIERLSADVETNIMLRTTCVTTMIEGGHAENALPQRARATLQCRVIPGESQDEVQSRIEAALADPTIKVSVMTPAIVSPDSVPTPAVIATVTRVTQSMWPTVIVLPEMSAGADDSIYPRNLGIPAYGIDGMFDDLDDGRAHGRDERIGVNVFDEELEFTYRLMKAFSTAPLPAS